MSDINKLFQSIINYFFYIFIGFIVLNLLISISWNIYSKFNLKNKKPYTKTQLELLDLTPEDGNILFNETWIDRHYVYDQFTEYKEAEQLNKKFVNIRNTNGRKIKNYKSCEKNFFFYGSSITFGYNVTDEQTFSFIFKKILEDNNFKKYCVFNFGRAGYGSTQENILFIKHLLNKKIKKDDFIFFLDGNAERGNKKGINTDYLTYAQNLTSQKYWDRYKRSFMFFWSNLPINQLISRIKEKYNLTNNRDFFQIKATFDEIIYVYEKNIFLREEICKIFNINCYSFLHPKSGLHGKYFDNFEVSEVLQTQIYNFETQKNKEMIEERKIYFNAMSNIENVIDISNSFNGATKISYIDRNHYSPHGHYLLAVHIFNLIKDDLNKN